MDDIIGESLSGDDIIGASLTEPHVVRSTAEISVVCLSPYVDVRSAERNLLLHSAYGLKFSI